MYQEYFGFRTFDFSRVIIFIGVQDGRAVSDLFGFKTNNVGIQSISLILSISSVPLLHTEQAERCETC